MPRGAQAGGAGARFLIDDLAAHVAGKEPGDLVFTGTRRGGVLRARVLQRLP